MQDFFDWMALATTLKYYSQGRSRVPAKGSINELIIWKMNPLVVPITSVKFKSAILHA